ncbi:hypothetical protein HHK36_028990 [Tetracentron sinense]|uniref:EGF-like domain-containing protein n=1 Tax=Tetracentron sinense TaxID=13715 RepID=A0A834YG12_TETSI|nr:hypothetical protein HHK36_028990 [Tetracentron sinense]
MILLPFCFSPGIMAEDRILGSVRLCLFVLFSCFLGYCSSYDQQVGYNSFTVSSFSYSETKLKPYDWRYIRIDLPPWFSSFSMALVSDVDLDKESIEKLPRTMLPIICFRDGSPPLPDVSNTSLKGLVLDSLTNGSVGSIHDLQNVEQCHPLQRNITVTLTNEQSNLEGFCADLSRSLVYWSIQWHWTYENTIKDVQITRGPSYSFSANISVEGCTTSTMWGQYCNQTVDPLSCTQSDVYKRPKNAEMYNQTVENVIACRNSFEASCHGDTELRVYSLEVVGMAEQLTIVATDVRFNQTPSSNNTGNVSGIVLMCYVRYGAMPVATLHDYSSDISKDPIVIQSPKVGRWYITIRPVNESKVLGGMQGKNINVCYSMEWQVLQCPVGKAGSNCTWEKFMLQTIIRKSPSVPFESYYWPIGQKISSESANFPLEPLLSNSSSGNKLDVVWTYFLLDIPHGAAGGNIHIQLISDAEMTFEIYARFGGLPSLDTWDYYYANRTSTSNGSMFFKLYDSSEGRVNFYVLYAREGTWGLGLRHSVSSGNHSKHQTTMSISIERCPKRCSDQGTCQSAVDASGLTLYSYCSCDRNHGGFDCSVEIVSYKGHLWQSVSLIASNAAAILPAFWALRQKAFAEWVLFTSSGISSGLYHACDVGTWCALSFHVLQFMDFWLSFMAVVSTFVYLAAIDEVSKRTIHTTVSILTALMAATGATRSTNIILVVAIGALGLLIGWLIEFSTTYRPNSCSLDLDIIERGQAIKGWLHNLMKTLYKRFRWVFVILGFAALSMAAISWRLETSESYWIWHSVWHVTIYTASFFFLCSKAATVDSANARHPDTEYELTRQDSLPRGE